MRKKFVTNLALLLILNLLIKPFWIFGIEVSVQNTVGAENYGFYTSLFSFSLILNTLLDLGITNYNNKNLSQHHQLLPKLMSNIVVLKFILGGIYFIVSILIALSIGYDKKQILLLIFLLLNQFLLSTILYLRSNVSALQFYITDSFLSVIDKLLMTLICAFLLWSRFTQNSFKIEWLVYSQTAAYSVTAIIVYIVFRYKSEHLPKIKFDINQLRLIIKQSAPFAVLVLLMASYNRIDSVLLERMLPNGKEQAGIYAQAFRFLDATAAFGYLFAALLLPMFSRMLIKKEKVDKLVLLSFKLISSPALILAISVLFYHENIMASLYHEHVSESSKILTVLMFSFIAIGTNYIFGTLLTADGKLKYLNIVASSSLSLNIVLNIIFIPVYGAFGAAIASLSTQSLSAVFQIFIAKSCFQFKFNLPLILKIFVFISLMFALGFFLSGNISNWLTSFLFFIASSSIIAILMGLLSIRDLLSIMKSTD